jgi:peptide/nickel transport system ATP-binding protein
MTDTVLELTGVSKAFERRRAGEVARVQAVDGVSLRVEAGEIVALVGESGAGKSTIGRIALGLERPDTGSVRLAGEALETARGRRGRALRRRAHLILQDPYDALHPGMRVGSVVAEPLAVGRIRRSEREGRVADALVEVGLVPAAVFARRYPHELSGGQRQRVALARALVARPRLVVADEPTSMLDASLRAGILELISGMRRAHDMAFLFVTHDLALARYVADRIGVVHEGRLVEVGETEALVAAPQHEYTTTLLDASERVR